MWGLHPPLPGHREYPQHDPQGSPTISGDPRPLRILLVDASREWRGGQVQTLLLAEGLRSLGHRVDLAAPAGGELARRLGLFHELPPGQGPRAALALRGIAGRLRPDVVAAQSSHAHGNCVLADLRPVVHRRVDFPIALHPLNRLKYGRARIFIAVSEAVARVLVRGGVPPARIRVIHDGVRPVGPSAPAPDLEGTTPLVGAIGALVPHKGHRVLLEAMALLPELRCVIAGEGPLRAEIEARIQRLGLDGRVRLLGVREDLPALLASLDLLVHPSLEEGMGQVVAEAMSARVPVLVSAAGGLPELVGPDGSTVPPGDVDALARAIRERTREQPSEAALDAMEARARTRFSVEAMLRGTLRAYHESLSAPPQDPWSPP